MRFLGAWFALVIGLGGCGLEYWTYDEGGMHLTGRTVRANSFPESP